MQRLARGSKAIRRARYVYEILPEPATGTPFRISKVIVKAQGLHEEIEYTTIFEWDPREDIFYPEDSKEVVKRSPRLRTIAFSHALTLGELADELDLRAKFISTLVKERVFDWKEVYTRMRKFYARHATVPG